MKYLPQLVALILLTVTGIAPGNAATRSRDVNADPALYSTDWRTTGPPGGDVRGLVVDPTNPDRFYFGTLDGQIYTSSDAGKNWQLLYNFGKPRLFVDHIIVDPRNPRVLYVGAHRHKEPGGFFKSTDGGQTFRESPELKNEAIHSLAQSDSDPSTLIAGTFNGIFRSDNAGDSWQTLPTSNVQNLFHVESLAIDPRSANIIYAGTWYLPFKSTDGGQTWRSIKTGIIDDSDIFAIDIDPRDPNHIIASACSGIYESKTAGESWKKVQGIWYLKGSNMGKEIKGIPEDLVDFDGNGKYSSPEFTWMGRYGPTAIKFLDSDKLGSQYENDLFVGDVHNGNIYHFDLNNSRTALSLRGSLADKVANSTSELKDVIFARGFGGITDLKVGNDGYLYVLSYVHGSIYRILPS